MEKTYLYTKRFIDKQVKTLNEPLQVTDSLRGILADFEASEYPEKNGSINEQQLEKVLLKVNQQIKRHNRNVFAASVVNQITEQLMEIEKQKLAEVKDKIARTGLVLRPLLVSGEDDNLGDLVGKLGDVVDDLPESKYLILADEAEVDTASADESGSHESDEDNQILVQDFQEKVNREPSLKKRRLNFRKQLAKYSKSRMEDENMRNLLQAYDEVRLKLKEVHHQLQYKHEKNLYLTGLSIKLNDKLGIAPQKTEIDDNSDYDTDENIDNIANEGLPAAQKMLPTETASSSFLHEIQKLQLLLSKIVYKVNTSNENVADALHEINKR